MIQKTLSDNGLSIPCIGAKNMEDAVNCAKRMAKFGLSFSMLEIAARNFVILSLLSVHHFTISDLGSDSYYVV